MSGRRGGALAALQSVAGAEPAGHARAGLRAREGDSKSNEAGPVSQKAPLVRAAVSTTEVALRRVQPASGIARPVPHGVEIKFYGAFSTEPALVDVHPGPSTGRASKLMQNRRCPV